MDDKELDHNIKEYVESQLVAHQSSSNRTFVDHVTQQDEAFNPVGSGESSDESEIESFSPVKSELNRALDFFKKKKQRRDWKKTLMWQNV